MNSHLLVLSFLLLPLSGLLQGQDPEVSRLFPEPPSLPDATLVTKLLGEEAEIVPNQINVAFIVRGDALVTKAFVTDHAVHAKFTWPILENGRRVRRVGSRTLYWNEQYGWFIYREVMRRGGEAIDICSELQGLLTIR